ncbi:MAG: TatD family deoxyribonuclease [Dehalococcoidia bacterium]|nr:TatD family deoxyribonuclease [Dehalococcoidia bacterium]
MATFVDSHTHIDQHDADEWPDIVARAQEAGVEGIITAGVTIESSERCVGLAEQFPGAVWAGVGVHPMDISGPLSDSEIERLRDLALHQRVVCISETGLDWEPGRPDRAAQEQAFRAQLRLAVELNLPVIFHNREAGMEPLRIIAEEVGDKVPAVAHYFQGPLDYARACLDQGIYLSLAKPLLRLPDLQEIVAHHAPLESMVLETDSYPQPYKKKRENWTEPRDVPMVAAKVAELKGITPEEVAETTTATIQKVLGRAIVV